MGGCECDCMCVHIREMGTVCVQNVPGLSHLQFLISSSMQE